MIFNTSSTADIYCAHVFVMCRYLLVNPKERRVVVVESILSSTTNFRNTLAKVLFQHFEVSFCSSHNVGCSTLEATENPSVRLSQATIVLAELYFAGRICCRSPTEN